MNACPECVMRSLLQNEALGFAENSLMPAERAKSLMQADGDRILELLAKELPGVEARLRSLMETLADGATRGGIWMVCPHDPDFPEPLKRLKDTPKALFGLGSQYMLAELRDAHPGAAIVGARRASAYGRDVAHSFGRDLVAAGMTVVSGMALGIDGAAHRGALSAGDRTIAVLAGGPDIPYPPSHRRLYEQIVERGAVISERPPGTRARRWGFPARNRVIAAISCCTVFVEGTRKSGARHTVEFASQVGLDSLAVPGPITSPLSEGPNLLIADQSARAAVRVEDILDAAYGVRLHESHAPVRRQPDRYADLDDAAGEVMRCVLSGDSDPRSIASSAPDLSTREIAVALGQLELSGHVVRGATGEYRPVLTRDPGRDD